MKLLIIGTLAILLAAPAALADKYLGKLSENQHNADSTSNPYGTYGSEHSPDSINNPYGRYGSPYSPTSPNNPYATNPPVLIGK